MQPAGARRHGLVRARQPRHRLHVRDLGGAALELEAFGQPSLASSSSAAAARRRYASALERGVAEVMGCLVGVICSVACGCFEGLKVAASGANSQRSPGLLVVGQPSSGGVADAAGGNAEGIASPPSVGFGTPKPCFTSL
mmetsp:Transcript_14905/g.52302  ORF Transcript_14905/g.52302 Transcript_14905/m.52302 type:complete len:140 (+) Transcript_14905:518-937(+)